jgi:NADH dehydrogenase
MTHRIVIVGGGAGGLELATRLGNRLGRNASAQITLVDHSPTHIWKPLLHEVAAGSLDPFMHQLEYIAQARWHHFQFQQGELISLDRGATAITVAAVTDGDGVQVLPQRRLAYDTLVIAIGSVTRFFDVPGAVEHSFTLDTAEQAERFRRRLISACMRAQNQDEVARRVDITLVGAGATGVELSAELRNSAQVFASYGLHGLDPRRDIAIRIIDTAPRILPALSERIAEEAARLLGKLGVDVIVGEQASEVRADAVLTNSGKAFPSTLTVWAAGIRAPAITTRLDGLQTTRSGQLVVGRTLQSVTDPHIFAFGDCASCPRPATDGVVPPTAQAANQQASFLARALPRRLAGEALPEFTYRDFGSLVSLGSFSAVGSLMSTLMRGSWFIEGMLARWSYAALYRRHLMALHGFPRMALDTLGQWLRTRTAPRVKLH